ncbi:MAG: peptidylprolyl isomerase [Bdellovibrionota bacterium]
MCATVHTCISISKREFNKIKKTIEKSADFAEVAKKQTKGPNPSQGGYMGKVFEKDLHENIKAALTKMEKDTVSNLIEMGNGYALVHKIDEGMEMADLTEEEKAKYTDQLFNQRVVEALNQNINRLKQGALIDTFL